MNLRGPDNQTKNSIQKNRSWFSGNKSYSAHVTSLDSYRRLREALDAQLYDCGRLLDVGNGGVFDYDTGVSEEITALDLFLDDIDVSSYPANIRFVQGSALSMPFPEQSFDSVAIVMLLHHLVGGTVEESRRNVQQCISECRRVLKPGGRLVIAESCVPKWFYRFESAVFRPASVLLEKLIEHPVTLQYTVDDVTNDLRNCFANCEITHIPKGRYILQFGIKVPSFVTPVQQYIFRVW
jgi:SAM-dependent methyltransferase